MNALKIALLLCVPVGAVLSQSPTSAVSGVVVERGTNKPLPRATLELQGNSQRYPGLTDGEGRFVFQNIPPGRYSLVASLNGYIHAEYGRKTPAAAGAGPRGAGRGAAGLRGTPSTSAFVEVDRNKPATGLRLVMAQAAAISGHVFNVKGEPFPYARVEALRVSYPEGERTAAIVSSVFTNDLGEYRLYGLPAGSYLIRTDTRIQTQQQMPVAASTTPPLPGGVVTQTAGGSIGYTGDPANQNNPLGNRGGRGVARGAAPADGPVLIPMFYRGATNDRDALPVDVRSGEDISGIDIVAAPVVFVNVVASVLSSNGTLNIWPTPSDGNRGGRGVAAGRGGEPRTMQFSLPPGSYILSGVATAAPGRGGTPDRQAGYAPVEVSAFGPAPSVTVSFNPTVAVSGRVVGERASSLPPADLTKLTLQFRRVPRIPNIPDPAPVVPNNEGSFSIRGLVDGEYAVEIAGFQGALSDSYPKAVRVAGGENADMSLRLGDSAGGEIEIVIAHGGGRLQGTVAAANEEVAAETTVVLIPANRSRRDLYKTAVSDLSGRFQIEGIAPGAYVLLEWEEEIVPGSWFAPDFLRLFEDSGTPVTISEKSNQTVAARAVPMR